MVKLHPQAHLDTVGAHGKGGRRGQCHGDLEKHGFLACAAEQPCKQRVTHVGHLSPEADVERAIESIAGTQWGEVVQDHRKWQELAGAFLAKFDIPWATGKQQSIQDNLLPNNRRGPPVAREITA